MKTELKRIIDQRLEYEVVMALCAVCGKPGIV